MAVTAVLALPFLCWLGAFMPEINLDMQKGQAFAWSSLFVKNGV